MEGGDPWGLKSRKKLGGNNFFSRVPPLDFQKCSIFPPIYLLFIHIQRDIGVSRGFYEQTSGESQRFLLSGSSKRKRSCSKISSGYL